MTATATEGEDGNSSKNEDRGLPPPDVPIDAVWVKPSDASLVLRARQVHEILQTDPSLQDTEEERLLLKLNRDAEAQRKAKALRSEDLSDTTGHAMAFARRISMSSSTRPVNTQGDNPSTILQRDGDIMEDSVLVLRFRSLLEFLLYEDAEKLMRSHPDPAKSGVSEDTKEMPEERDEEDEMIAARQRNIRRLGRSGNWGSFVEDLAARFPLKHPVNLDAQDRLLVDRDAKARRLRNETERREPFNVLKTRPKSSAMATFGR